MRTKLFIKLFLLVSLLVVLWSSETLAEPPTYYQYLTNFETTLFDEVIWFWSVDAVWGHVRSNDYLGIMYNPTFYGRVITSKDSFINNRIGHPHFEYEPIFNAPPYPFPDSYPHIVELANIRIVDQDGAMMTRVALRGEDGIQFYQSRLGVHNEEELVVSIDPPENEIIYVDGQVELEGVLTGRATIYSTGDMWLTDNVRYLGSRENDGRFSDRPNPDNLDEVREQMSEMEHMLGLVSERNIIIKNNVANGRENGFNGNPNNIDRHSIVINAALVALGESFTFQHQNDNHNRYQGPQPDERGIIHLTGGVTQYRRGYVHRSNHDGTGYGRDYVYDFRFENDAPPGFEADVFPDLNGQYERLDLFIGPYNIQNTTARTVIIRAGVEVNLTGINALTVTDTLIIEGSDDNPVTINTVQLNGRSTLLVDGDNTSLIDVNNAVFTSSVVTRFQGNSVEIHNSEFGTESHFTGNVTLDSNRFAGSIGIESWGDITVSRSLFEDGITLLGNTRTGTIINNTIVNGPTGIDLRGRFDSLRIANSIIAYNEKGIVNHHWEQPVIEYCDVYGNQGGNYEDCEAADGCISQIPRFIDRDHSDYHLAWNSPCIDAGDPDAPRDPDETIADIGAYYRDRSLSVAEDVALPEAFTVTASPNPFNRTATINFTLPQSQTVHIAVYDIQGRSILTQSETHSAGIGKMLVSGERLGGAGVYFARVEAGDDVGVAKLVYVP